MLMDETEAIACLKRKDITGLETLVSMYQGKALRAALLVTRDRSSAEDIVQSAFVRAYERFDQFDRTRPFGPWFLRIVINAALKEATRREKQLPLDYAWQRGIASPDGHAAPASSPEALLERAETRQEVREALAKLSPLQRAAVILRYYVGLTEGETAAQMGSPIGTVKRRLFEGRQRLKAFLKP